MKLDDIIRFPAACASAAARIAMAIVRADSMGLRAMVQTTMSKSSLTIKPGAIEFDPPYIVVTVRGYSGSWARLKLSMDSVSIDNEYVESLEGRTCSGYRYALSNPNGALNIWREAEGRGDDPPLEDRDIGSRNFVPAAAQWAEGRIPISYAVALTVRAAEKEAEVY